MSAKRRGYRTYENKNTYVECRYYENDIKKNCWFAEVVVDSVRKIRGWGEIE